MSAAQRRHPLLRYSAILFCGAVALALLGVSWICNPHSAAWLLGILTTTGLLIAALRGAKKSSLHRAYALYLAMLTQYLICVWLLHVNAPGGGRFAAKRDAAFWAWFFYPGLIFNAQAHLHFALRFADVKSKWMHRLNAVCWIVSFFFFVQNCLGLFVLDYVWAGFTWVPTLDGGYGYFFPFTTFLLTLGILVPIVKATSTPSHQRRLQLAYYVIGAAPVWITCWGNFLISWGLNIYPAGGVFFLLHAAIIGYAVFKHRVFDFTIVIRRGLAYAAVSLILGLLYGGLLWAGAWRLSALGAGGLLSSIVFVFVVGLVFAPLLGYFQRNVDRFFFRQSAERQRLLAQFARETAATVQLATVAESLCRALEQSFSPRRVQLFLNDEAGRPVLFATCDHVFTPAPWPSGETLPESVRDQLAGAQEPFRVSLASEAASAPYQGGLHFSEESQALAVPLHHREESLGCALLGPKKADDIYDDDDIRFAETLAAHSSTALLNARSFARLQQLQALTDRTLEELNAGVMVVSGAGRIVRANRAARKIALAPFPESLDQIAALHPELGVEITRAIRERTPITNHELSLAIDKPRFFLLSVCELGGDPAQPLHLVIFYDITEYKELEASARQREALARVGETIASINHEIRNVIQPIRYQVDQLAALQTDDRVLKRVIKIVPDRLSALEKLLANLRDLSRPIELRKRPVDIADLVDSIWLDLRDSTMAAGAHFEKTIPDESRVCVADGHWLRQVLVNVIKNALEAGAGREAPSVAVRTEARENQIRISIEDNGCGISETSSSRLFEPFFSTKGESGTGLGLSISRRIIELHGGELTFIRAPERGTIFQISLPHQPQSAPSPIGSLQ